MHGICFDYHLSEWFDFKVPRTTLAPDYIESKLDETLELKERSQFVWLGKAPLVHRYTKKKGKKQIAMIELVLMTSKTQINLQVKEGMGEWLKTVLTLLSIQNNNIIRLADFRNSYEEAQLGDFDVFINSYTFSQLREAGLLVL